MHVRNCPITAGKREVEAFASRGNVQDSTSGGQPLMVRAARGGGMENGNVIVFAESIEAFDSRSRFCFRRVAARRQHDAGGSTASPVNFQSAQTCFGN